MVTRKRLHWLIMGEISGMKTEMGYIQDEWGRKPSTQQCRDGACKVSKLHHRGRSQLRMMV